MNTPLSPTITASHFGPLDYVALGVYLGALVLVGLYFARREKTSHDFFLAGGRIPWWAAGLSLMATQVSSIGFMAVPAKAYATDWAYFTGVFTCFLVVPIVTRAYIPFFRRLGVTSAYEYLEKRFHLVVRLLGTTVYSLLQLGRMAVVLYLPALALSTVTGLNVYGCILIMGVLCTLYTVAGGIEAVVWTDVIQAILLIGGALVCVGVVLFDTGSSPAEFWEIASAENKFSLGQLDFDMTAATVWVVLIGNFFIRLGSLTSDQAIVQRYLTTRDEAASKKALWVDVAMSIPWAIIVFLLGTALFVFYRLHPNLLPGDLAEDAIVPFFVVQQIPTGLSGLIIAAVFAAAMSSLDSAMHSTATIWVTDYWARFRPESSDRTRLRLAQCFTLVLGLFGTATALWMAASDIRSVWDHFQTLMGLFIGGLSGLFVLGIFTRRTGAVGAILGQLGSATILIMVIRFTSLHFFLYPAIGCSSCCAIGYLSSFFLPGPRQTEGLTIFSPSGPKTADE